MNKVGGGPLTIFEYRYGSHLAAEGIEPFITPRHRRAMAVGGTAMLALSMKVVLDVLREAAGEEYSAPTEE